MTSEVGNDKPELGDWPSKVSLRNDSMNEDENNEVDTWNEIFNKLYEDHDLEIAKEASKRERKENGYISSTLIYGEIDFKPFAHFFLRIKNKYGGLRRSGGVFVDIGCGSGKPTFAAALLHDFESCIGIEILSNLHAVSLEVLEKWKRDISHTLNDAKKRMKIKFINDDATVVDWSDADIVFANSTCFDEHLMKSLASSADQLGLGSFFVTTTKKLPSSSFEVVEVGQMKETWGTATIFIQKKVR